MPLPTSNYYVVFCVRDSVNSIEESVMSWLEQSHPPSRILAVDDGSSDGTTEILQKLNAKYESLTVIRTENKARDYTRIASLWNMVLSPSFKNTYHVISAGDIIVPKDYAGQLITAMDKDEMIVVASGTIEGTYSDVPRGAGRFVRESYFWANYTNGYPVNCAYEAEVIERAKMLGYKLLVLHDLQFKHVEKLGGKHHFREEGRGMKCLGYHPLYALGRIIIVSTRRDVGIGGAASMLKEYALFRPEKTGYFRAHDELIRRHIRREQMGRIKTLKLHA